MPGMHAAYNSCTLLHTLHHIKPSGIQRSSAAPLRVTTWLPSHIRLVRAGQLCEPSAAVGGGAMGQRPIRSAARGMASPEKRRCQRHGSGKCKCRMISLIPADDHRPLHPCCVAALIACPHAEGGRRRAAGCAHASWPSGGEVLDWGSAVEDLKLWCSRGAGTWAFSQNWRHALDK